MNTYSSVPHREMNTYSSVPLKDKKSYFFLHSSSSSNHAAHTFTLIYFITLISYVNKSQIKDNKSKIKLHFLNYCA